MAYAGFNSYEELFSEQEKRWNTPSETMESYLARVKDWKQQQEVTTKSAKPPIRTMNGCASHNNKLEEKIDNMQISAKQLFQPDNFPESDLPRDPPTEPIPIQEKALADRYDKRKASPSSPPGINKRRRSTEQSVRSAEQLGEGSSRAISSREQQQENIEFTASYKNLPARSIEAQHRLVAPNQISRPPPNSLPTVIIEQTMQQVLAPSISRSDSAISNASTTIEMDVSSISSPRNSSPLPPPILHSADPSLPELLPTSKKVSKRAVPLHKMSTLPVPSKAAAARTGKQKKEKEKLVTPLEYAQKLQVHLSGSASEAPPGASHTNQLLLGQTVWYYGSDNLYASESTRKRMKLIMNYGAKLLPKFDLRLVTHIVTDNRATKGSMLRAAYLKSLEEIPTHVPIVKWDWVEASARAGRMVPCMEFPIFPNRVPVDEGTAEWITSKAEWAAKLRDAGEDVDRSADLSRISDFSDYMPTPKSQPSNQETMEKRKGKVALPTILPSPVTEDPLAEFYEQAKAEVNDNTHFCDSYYDNSHSILSQEEPDSQKIPSFQCDRRHQGVSSSICPNQDIIDKLSKLKQLHDSKPSDDDHWRSYSYSKTIRALRSHPQRIATTEDALAIPGVGQKTAQKIMEIIETGHLRRIDSENTEEAKVVKLFTGVYGVGILTARRWYFAGCRTLQDLVYYKGGVTLTESQEIGIRYFDDINSRMSREEAALIFTQIKNIARKIDPKLFIEIMGSYRRGKKDCGDIDILISRDPSDGKIHTGVLRKLLDLSRQAGIITEDLTVLGPHEWDELETVYRGLCVLPGNPDARRRRIDFLSVEWKARGAALLYYTGDDIFNRSMRLKARKDGYSLNQKGLWAGVIRDPKDRSKKLHEGTLIASETEREIFDILCVPWQEPHERVRS